MGRETFTQQLGVHFPTDLCRCGDSGPLLNIQVRYPELQPCPLLQSWGQWGREGRTSSVGCGGIRTKSKDTYITCRNETHYFVC